MSLSDDDKLKYKDQFRKIALTAQLVASLTPTTVDDKIANILASIASNDELFEQFLALGEK